MISIALDRLIRDDEIRPRAAMSGKLVGKFISAMDTGAVIPPVDVVYDGNEYWLFDGFHRVHAALHLQRKKIDAQVHSGDRRDAWLLAAAANQFGGAPRTGPDKRRAALRFLVDGEWSYRSDGMIAKKLGVGQPFVSRLRRGLPPEANPGLAYASRLGADHKLRDVAKVGRRPKRIDLAGPTSPDDLAEEGRDLARRYSPAEFQAVLAAYREAVAAAERTA